VGAEKQWAADSFTTKLDRQLELLSRLPELGERRPEAGQGMRSSFLGDHVVFYLAVAGGIEVVRVLHQSRDVEGQAERAGGF